MNVVKKTFQYGDHEVTLETGRIARQATGSVMVTMGSTSVLCTVVAEQKAKPGQPFFPLSVHTTCTSFMNPSSNRGRMGRSISLEVNVSFSLGRASRLKKPPGILPTE